MEKDLPSNSDESDEDFVPEAHQSSEEENSTSGHSEGDSDNEEGSRSRKRRKLTKKKKKKKKDEGESINEEKEEKPEKVTDVDALWKDFKEDVSRMEKQVTSNSEKAKEEPVSQLESEKPVECNSNSSSKLPSQPQRRSFPSTVNTGSKLGLSKILNQIGKKDKMSTLAKSQLDWNNFKKSEGIEEEIKMHNRGKDGYLDKQDFLQRTDLRQFEIEKQLRATSRRKF